MHSKDLQDKLPATLAPLAEELARVSCPLCLELLRDPRTLPCSHTLCRDCILSLRTVAMPAETTIRCPCCRHPFQFRDDKGLPVDSITRQVLENIKALDKARNVQCERCDKRRAAFACKTCDMLYCGACCELLHQGKMKFKHDVTSIDTSVRKQLPFCSKPGHEDYRTELYSPQTREFLCLQCVRKDPQCRAVPTTPALELAADAKQRLQSWLGTTHAVKDKLRRTVAAVDQAVRAVELATDQELANLEDLLRAMIAQLERQCKAVADGLIDRRQAEVGKLCGVRKDVVGVAVQLADDIARVQKAFAESDAVELISADQQLVAQPAVVSIVLPNYCLPVVGPGQALPECFTIDYPSAEDQIFADLEFQPGEQWRLVAHPKGKMLTTAPEEPRIEAATFALDEVPAIVDLGEYQELNWALDPLNKGVFIHLSNNNNFAGSVCNDCYEDSTVLSDHVMEGSGVWCWRLRMTALTGTKRVCFGVTQRPFSHKSPNPYQRIWGWATNGCNLPFYERSHPEAKMHTGEEVLLRLDCDSGHLTGFWPKTGHTDVLKLGSRTIGKPLHAAVILAWNGNKVELLPAQPWEFPV